VKLADLERLLRASGCSVVREGKHMVLFMDRPFCKALANHSAPAPTVAILSGPDVSDDFHPPNGAKSRSFAGFNLESRAAGSVVLFR
jgi:hypothetical protein